MKTLKEALQEIDDNAAKKRKELETEYSILQLLPPEIQQREPSVFVHQLYDRKATVTVKVPRVDIPALLRLLPEPMETCLVKGTFTSIFTAEHAATVPDDRVKSQERIFPYHIKAEPNFSRVLKLEFFGRLPGFDGVLEFNFETPIHEWYKDFSLSPEFETGHGSRGEYDKKIVRSTRVNVGDKFYNVMKPDGQCIAGWGQSIRWARGEVRSIYMNDVTGYWTPYVEGLDGVREVFADWLATLN